MVPGRRREVRLDSQVMAILHLLSSIWDSQVMAILHLLSSIAVSFGIYGRVGDKYFIGFNIHLCFTKSFINITSMGLMVLLGSKRFR